MNDGGRGKRAFSKNGENQKMGFALIGQIFRLYNSRPIRRHPVKESSRLTVLDLFLQRLKISIDHQ